jgi:hypothetical protein
MSMLKKIMFALSVAAIALTASQSEAMPIAPGADSVSMIVHVANGCGRGRYRGPGGACHWYGRGPYPGGYYGGYRNAWRWNGCPPGYWHGPWGHCRDTPYHGRLPGGGWK